MEANIVRDEDPAGEAARDPLCTRAEPEAAARQSIIDREELI